MKIIITKKQFNFLQENDTEFSRTKKLITSMFEQGNDIDDIKKLTGLNQNIIVLCLKDKPMINFPGDCLEIHNLLYNYLWNSEFIEKKRVYDDGSEIYLDFDTMAGSVSFDYYNSEGNRLFGYATFLWDGDCTWPLDGEEFTWGEKKPFLYNKFYGDIDYHTYYGEFKNMKSLEDIANFFNNHYFDLIKQPIESLIESYIMDELDD